MNQSKARLLNRLTSRAIVEDPTRLEAHCRRKAEQINVQGGRQHVRINPRRQMKNAVKLTLK